MHNNDVIMKSSQFFFVVLFLSIRKVEVETNNNHTRRDIYNVIAVLRGSVEPGGLPCAYYNVNRSLFRESVEPDGWPCAY